LNPDSFKHLCRNIKINNVASDVFAYNECGRSFIKKLMNNSSNTPSSTAPEIAPSSSTSGGMKIDHVIMNLPASAPEFLNAFHSYLPPASAPDHYPTIHVYCFTKEENLRLGGIQMCEQYLGKTIPDDETTAVHTVRLVAPHKTMLCVSFKVRRRINRDILRSFFYFLSELSSANANLGRLVTFIRLLKTELTRIKGSAISMIYNLG
jgi:tRNA (guanine37-N1)-methyltransferase